MAAEKECESFLEVLRLSGVVPNDKVQALLTELSDQGKTPENVRGLADEFVRREVLTEWQAEMLLRGKHRGFHLGPYVILRPLGHGNMGSVLLAHHEMMHRRCAIKILPNKYREDPDLLNRFQLEARAVAALDHPNIVRAYDFNKDVRDGSEVYYLVMEYVEGQDLQRMVEENGALETQKAADLIRQAALGLAHAHEAGFVHRDVKPANLLVDAKGTLKILDLGLAKFAFEVENASHAGTLVIGTPDYMAPEQTVDSAELDSRADIYSLGHTFYFLLVGHRPFPRGTVPELLMAHCREQPEPINDTRPDVSFDLVAIIDKMTAKSPAQRYQTAKEVAESLQTWLHNAASGRSYSRMAALRSAAMQSKQRSSREASRANSQTAATPEPELELVPLDDQPTRTSEPTNASAADTGGWPSASDTNATASGNRPAERGRDDRASKPAPVREPSRPDRPKTASSSGSGDRLPKIAPQQRVSVPPLAPVLPPSAPVLPAWPVPRASFRRTVRRALKSPGAWIALGGLLVVGLLLVIVVSLTSSRGPGDRPKPTQAPPAGVPKVQDRPEQPPGTKQAEPFVVPPPKDRNANAPLASEVAASRKPAADPVPKPIPPRPQVERAVPPPETIVPAAKVVTSRELLAGINAVSFRLQSVDSAPDSKMNLMIKRLAVEAAKRIGIAAEENAPATMEIELRVNEGAEFVDMVIAAELKCPGQGAKVATVWKGSKQLASIKARTPTRGPPLAVLRKGVDEFFDQFANEVRQARSNDTPADEPGEQRR